MTTPPITYVIPGVTLIDQLHEATSDGQVDEDANDNCVAASIAEGLHILTGKVFNGDEVKDTVYGQGYVGVQSARAYTSYCDTQGITLAYRTGNQAQLVACIHAEVSAGHPVLVTMPSMWATAPTDPVHPSGSTHVGIAVGVGAGVLRVMNPWHGFFQDQTDAWWQARLCYGQVWMLTRKVASMTSTVPTGWSDNGKTLTAPNGKHVTLGFRDYILTHTWSPTNVPLAAAQGRIPAVLSQPSLGGGTFQVFSDLMLAWTSAKGVFEVELGEELEAVSAQVAQANVAVAALQRQLTTAEAKNASLNELPAAETAALKADIGGLKAAADALDHLTTLGTSLPTPTV